MLPPTNHKWQTQGDTKPIGWTFSQSVDGAEFEFVHSHYGTFTLTGVDRRVEFPITESRASAATTDPAAPYTYTLVINPGVEGAEETAARGRWHIVAREAA